MDGEDTTLVVMDTWEAEKRVWHGTQDLGEGVLSLVPDPCPLLGHDTAGTWQRPSSAAPKTHSSQEAFASEGRRTS